MTKPTSTLITDVTAQSFQQEVLDRSHSLLVVIDFWAAWCEPCRVLGPVLEKLARDYDGKFVLAKIDTDAEVDLAIQFGVRSIPAVIAVRDGQAVDGFVGVQPETVIRMWIDRLLPTPAESLAGEGRALEQTNPEGAAEKYRAALAIDPEFSKAQTALARIALAQGRLEEAQAQILEMERRGFLDPEAEKVKAELLLRQQAGQAGGIEAARAALADNPSDPNLKFQLAEAMAAAGQYADALALCLELVERDRKGTGEQARQTMIAIFQLLPPESELVTEYQRQLSLALSE